MKIRGLFVPQLPLAKFTIFLHKFNESSSSLYTKRVYSYKMSFKRNFVVWAEYIINSTRLPLLKTKQNILNIKIMQNIEFLKCYSFEYSICISITMEFFISMSTLQLFFLKHIYRLTKDKPTQEM